MTTTTQPHDSLTCNGRDGRACEMCAWANTHCGLVECPQCYEWLDATIAHVCGIISTHALVEDVVATVAGDLGGDSEGESSSGCNCPFHRLSLAERAALIDAAIGATNAEIAEDQLADFDYAWPTAPRSMRNYVEREVAEFWYLTGQRDGYALATKAHNGDLREMGRVMELRREG